MVGNVFSQSPLETELERQRREREAYVAANVAPAAPALDPQQAFEGLASTHQVPVNILMSMAEASGSKDQAERFSLAEQYATRLAPRLAAGESVPDAMAAEFGTDFQPDQITSVLDRARAIADEFYPSSASPSSETQDGDPFDGEGAAALLKRRGQQAVRGVTQIVAAAPESLAIANRGLYAQSATDASNNLPQLQDELEDLVRREDAFQDIPIMLRRVMARKEEVEREIHMANMAVAANEGVSKTPVQDTALFQAGDKIRDTSVFVFGEPDPRDDSLWAKVAEGAGNLAGFIAVSGVGAAVAGPGGAMIAGGGAGSALNTSSEFKAAIEAGVDEETALVAAKWGAAIGASEIVPILGTLRYLPKKLRSQVSGAIIRRLGIVALGAGEEAAQEFLATVANNISAQNIYDAERGTFDDAGEAALIGAILGGGTGAGGAIFSGGQKGEDNGQGGSTDPSSDGGPDIVDQGVRDLVNDGAEVELNGVPIAPDPEVPSANREVMDETAVPPVAQEPVHELSPPQLGPLGRAASNGPAPLSLDLETGEIYDITSSGSSPMAMQFIQAEPNGLLFEEDGQRILIPREEFDSGETVLEQTDVRMQPREPQQTAPSADEQPFALTPRAGPAQGTPPVVNPASVIPVEAGPKKETPHPNLSVLAQRGMDFSPQPKKNIRADTEKSVEEARNHLVYLKRLGSTNGWSNMLIKQRNSMQAIIERAEPTPETLPATDISEIKSAETKRDGSAFASEATARQAMTNRGLNLADFDIISRDKGFVGVKRAEPENVSAKSAVPEVSEKAGDPTASPKPSRQSNGDMDVEAIKRIFARGDTVTDIGQIDVTAHKWLKRQLLEGGVERDQNYAYPNPKTRWASKSNSEPSKSSDQNNLKSPVDDAVSPLKKKAAGKLPPSDPLRRKGDWQDAEIFAVDEDGSESEVSAKAALASLFKRHARAKRLLRCLNA